MIKHNRQTDDKLQIVRSNEPGLDKHAVLLKEGPSSNNDGGGNEINVK